MLVANLADYIALLVAYFDIGMPYFEHFAL